MKMNVVLAVSYAYISYLMSWIKYHYPVEFLSATLSLTEDNSQNEYKRTKYVRLANDLFGIKVMPPDINHSQENFSFDKKKKIIYFGLSSIKGVGEESYKTLIEKRPYNSLQDIFDKVPKKYFNKRVGIALIKSGALDSFNKNRLELLKEFYIIRKDKFEDFNTDEYDDKMSIAMERETLGINLTHKTWWESVPRNKKFDVDTAFIIDTNERTDKHGRLMAFVTLSINGCEVKGIVFASTYSRYQAAFRNKYGRISLVGKKDDRDSLIINSARIA